MQYLLDLVGARVAISLIVAAAYIVGYAALQVAILALYTGLSFALTPWMANVVAYALALLPSNLDVCASALISARLGKWLWERQVEWMKLVGKAA